MGEIFERTAPVQALPWTGERLTSETGGQVEIEHLHRYFVARALCRGLDVLDIASGEGYGTALLAQTARTVTGVEISPDAVQHATQSYSRSNLRYVVGDARAIPLPDASVDAVVSFETIEHFFEHDRFLQEVRRVLRPGGLFIVSSPERDVYSPAGGTPNPHHVHELTRVELESLLRRHFPHVALYGQRPLLGAALIPEAPEAEGPFLTFERRDARLFEGSNGLPRAIYLVAICSDVPRPGIQGSLYVETSGVEGVFASLRTASVEAAALRQRDAQISQLTSSFHLMQEQAERIHAQHVKHVAWASAELAQAGESQRRLQDALGAAEERFQRLAGEREAAEERFQRLAREREAELQERLAGAEARVQAIWSSTSWRITAPLRFVLRRVPALHRLITAPTRVATHLLRGHPPLPANPPAVPIPATDAAEAPPPPASGPAEAPPPPASGPAEAPPELPQPRLLVEVVPATTGRVSFRLDALPEAPPGGEVLARQPCGERVLCVTHVVPFPPRAGNEYRIHQMLRFLASQGRDVLLVLCPLPNEPFSDAQAEALARVYPSLIICHHDGRLRHSPGRCADLVAPLAGRVVRDAGALLGEQDGGNPARARLIGLQRAFCPDPLVELLLHLEGAFMPAVLLAEYVFMTRPMPLLRRGALKIVDTIDAYSSKAQLVEQHGVTDGLAMSDEQEAFLLGRADVALAIQDREAAIFRNLAPACEVVTVGVDLPVLPSSPLPRAPRLLMVASGNPMNVKGLRDFLRYCWPLIRQEAGDAEFHVVGSAGIAVGFAPDGVVIHGRVDDLAGHYAAARVVVNPVVAGTGLKIKTIEAIAHLRAVVCWPAGADGLSGAALEACHVVSDWTAFAAAVVQLLRDDQAAGAPALRGAELSAAFSPGAVYGPLLAALDRGA